MANWFREFWTHLRNRATVRETAALGAMQAAMVLIYAWRAGDFWNAMAAVLFIGVFSAGIAKKDG